MCLISLFTCALFTDVRGYDYPKPYFDTKVKVRWDDNRLYIAARMQETDFWGTFTQDESLGTYTKARTRISQALA